jgi:hypothetical protein
MFEPIFMKLGMYIMAPEPISTEYIINPSHQPVCLYVYPTIVARQWIGKKVTGTVNIHATIEQLLDAPFCILCRIKGKYAISCSQNVLFLVHFTVFDNTVNYRFDFTPLF